MSREILPLLFFSLAVGACSPDSMLPTSSDLDPQIAVAPPANTNNHAIWVVDDLGGLASDGVGAYQHNVCAVETTIFTGGSGDLTLNVNNNSCRSLWVNLGSLGLRKAWFINVRQAVQLAPGASRTQPLRIYVEGVKSCGYLEYNLTVGSEVLVTAGTDALGRRTWTAASTGNSAAGCYSTVKGKVAWDGVVRVVPMRVSITQID